MLKQNPEGKKAVFFDMLQTETINGKSDIAAPKRMRKNDYRVLLYVLHGACIITPRVHCTEAYERTM
jgi:hypothetical protein